VSADLPLPPWDHQRTCDLVGEEISRFADLVQGADMDQTVVTCPDWSMGKLIRHVGTVHRWAGAMVEVGAAERMDPRTLDLGLPEHPSWLPGWLASGGEELVDRLRRADPDQPMWAWGFDQHARFWARRMLHESLVHRADAEITLGTDTHPSADPEIAVDGIDELFTNLPSAAAFSPGLREMQGKGSFGIAGGDSTAEWVVTLLDDGFDAWRVGTGEAREADALLTGFTGELLMLLYRRQSLETTNATVAGDVEVVTAFLDHAALE
jgi:uncharacterized protein (TIGR03083 family)